MKRREFITLAGGAAAWPVVARAQQSQRMRRVGMLVPLPVDNFEGQARVAALRNGLKLSGWIEGQNIQIDVLWSEGDPIRIKTLAMELVNTRPDVIVASASPAMAALQDITRDVPIVFVQVTDPVAKGIVSSLSRPGANVTGFSQYEYSVVAKAVELLKELAPHVARANVIFDPAQPSAIGELKEIQIAASTIGIAIVATPISDAREINEQLAVLGRESDGGLIVLPGPRTNIFVDDILTLSVQYRLPAVYLRREWVAKGGLASYGVDPIEMYEGAGAYVNRILRGEKPGDLPVQQATKFHLAINLKTAKALGLTVPQTLLVAATEIIE